MPDSLLAPPAPLTPLQRKLVWAAALAVAVTRLFALSESIWDWDEAQFAAAVRDYNVGEHHPHPPGFPIFIALAKLVRLVAPSDFAALQTVVTIAAIALFPLAFLLGRELRFRFSTAFCGALLFVFLPNVWFYGGTAYSDVPGAALTIAAAAMLLRGCRDERALLIGALLLGLAAAMRPQALLLGAAPLGVAIWIQWRQSWRRVVAAVAIVGATVVASYAGAALASESVENYIVHLRFVGEWVRNVDAFTSPGRPKLSTLLDEYFVRPMGAGRLGIVVSVLAALGALRGLRRTGERVGLAILTFLPFAVFAYLSLDFQSIHRYSTAYLFLWTLLAAHAVAPVWRWPAAGQYAVLLLMTARYAQWTGVMLTEVRDEPAPTHAAAMWIRDRVPPGRRVWIDPALRPLADYFLFDRDVQFTARNSDFAVRGAPHEYFVVEGALPGDGARVFRRPIGRIWDVARRRYFAVTVIQIGMIWRFGDGWYGDENWNEEWWRWMSDRGEIEIPRGGREARLRLTLEAVESITPTVEVVLNGQVIDRFPVTAQGVTRSWIVPSRSDAPNRLVLRASTTVNPKKRGLFDDPRDLSVRLKGYLWQPLR